ncbi:hypothetical protein EAF04_000925 [Stromatinia cepivora]|nr:hypothetical protein EAF04_000925 [Stromatinia cepivora]
MYITFEALLFCLLCDSIPFVLAQVVVPINPSLSQTSVVSILSPTTSTADAFRSAAITTQSDLIPVSSILLATSNDLSMPINATETTYTTLESSYQAQILHFDSSHRAISTTIEWITRSASLPPSTSTTTITYLPDGSKITLSESAISTTDSSTTTQIPPESPTSTTDTSTRIVSESTISIKNSDTTTLIPAYTINSSTTTQISSESDNSATILVQSATSPADSSTTTQILAESTIPTKVTSTTNQISYKSKISTIDPSTQIPSEATTSTIYSGTTALTPTHTIDSSTTTLIPAYTIKSRKTSQISTELVTSTTDSSTTDSSTTTQVRTTQNSRPSRSLRTSTIEIVSTTLDVSTSTVPTATDFVTPSSPLDQTFSNEITSLISTSRVSKSEFNSESNATVTTPITPTSAALATINPAPAATSSAAASALPPPVSSSTITGSFLPGDMAASTTITYLNSTYTLIQVYTRSHSPA